LHRPPYPPQETHIVTLTLILPASQARALEQWLRGLTMEDYLTSTGDRQHTFDVMCAARYILDELIASGIVQR
jgi:hypothetical protein